MKPLTFNNPHVLTIFLLVLFANISTAQNQLAVHKCKGKISLNNGDTLLAIHHFRKAIEFDKNEPYTRLLILPLLTDTSMHGLAIGFSEELIFMGYPSSQISNLISSEIRHSEKWKNFEMKIPELEKKYKNSIDTLWVNILDSLIERDQSIRRGDYSHFDNPDSLMSLKNSMRYIDSLNFRKLLSATSTRGFPTTKKTGYLGVNNAFILLWHHRGNAFVTDSMWTQIKPFIDKEINNGNLTKGFYAMFVDYYDVENKLPMHYGSLYAYYRNSENFDSLEVIDPENLDQRRSEIGFAPILLWLEANQIPIPFFLKQNKIGLTTK